MTLADLDRGQQGIVEALAAEGVLRQRLLDLGLVPGTCVQVQFVGAGGRLAAYRVRGSVFALRRAAAAHILIRAEEEYR